MEFHRTPVPRENVPEITPPGPEFTTLAQEITPPGPEITAPAPEFGGNPLTTSRAPNRGRGKAKWLAAFALAAVLVCYGSGKNPETQAAEPVPTEHRTTEPAPSGTDSEPTEPEMTAAASEPAWTEETEPEALGQVHVTVYAGIFDGESPVGDKILLEKTFLAGEFTDLPLEPPEEQEGYTFLGYVTRIQEGDRGRYIALDGVLTSETAGLVRADENGGREIKIYGTWAGNDPENAFLPLTLDANGGAGTEDYDAAGPLLSGTNVFLCAFPTPNRPGWRFAGWFTEPEGGEEIQSLTAAAFFETTDNGVDWSQKVPVTLYAHWLSE